MSLSEFNPKTHQKKKRTKRVIQFDDFDNPIPAEIQDTGELKKFFDEHKKVFVPYSGVEQCTSHSTLNFLIRLSELGTQSACTNGISRHAFGGKIDIVKKVDPDFDLGINTEVNPTNKELFHEFIKSQILWHDAGERNVSIRKFAKNNFIDFKASGNYYIELTLVETAGVKSAFVYTHKPTTVLYLLTKKRKQRYVGVSPIWTNSYINQNPPDLLPLYPAFLEENGVKRTMMHVVNGNPVWYGRPDHIGSFVYQYRELQDSVYQTKIAANNFVGQVIAEIEDDNPELNNAIDDEEAQKAGFDSTADRIEQNFTNKSDDPQTFMLLSRPYGAKPISVVQLKPNTSHEWYKVSSEIAEKKIVMANQWSLKLLGGGNQASGLSSNTYKDELDTKKDLIEDYRLLVSKPINTVIEEVAKFFGYREFLKHSISFKSPSFELTDDENKDVNNTLGGS